MHLKCPSATWIYKLHQRNINRSGSNTQSLQTLRATSLVLLSTSWCSQTPLELSKVLSDSARSFSGASESTCSYGGAIGMLHDMTDWIVKFCSSWDLCADLRESSREVESTAPICGILWEQPNLLLHSCGTLGAVFSPQWVIHNHKSIHLIIFIFVTVTRIATS